MFDEPFIQKTVIWFSEYFNELDRIIETDFSDVDYKFSDYKQNFLLIFYDNYVLIKKNPCLTSKVKPIISPKLILGAQGHLKYNYVDLKKRINEDAKHYARININYELENYESIMPSDEEVKRHEDMEEEYQTAPAENQKRYLSSLTSVINETMTKKFSEIKDISDFHDRLYSLADSPDSDLLKNNKNLWWSFYIMLDQVQLFMDLLSIGNYETASLPLRRMYETVTHAIYFDLKMRENPSIQLNIQEWMDDTDYDRKHNIIRGMTNKNKPHECILGAIIATPLVGAFPELVYSNLQDIYKELSFGVHKDKPEFRIYYELNEIEFMRHHAQFMKLKKIILNLIILADPKFSKKITVDDKTELFLLEHYK